MQPGAKRAWLIRVDIYPENYFIMSSTPRTEEFRDHLSTVDEGGKRIWVYPRKPEGTLHTARAIVAAVLLVILFGAPFIRVNDQPLFLFNIFERKFVLFGQAFFPQDFYLFGLLMIIFFVFIILFTVVFGRVWCGWACPQTIFMEMVFRKIEYWIEGDASRQKALNQAPWTTEKIVKKTAKHSIFIAISLLIAHLLMAYLVGVDEVKQIVMQSPANNLAGFTGLIVFTAVFYLVFAKLRELACTMICPYGRLQGVLLVKESIVVIYDYLRGEPRGRLKKQKTQRATAAEAPKNEHAKCLGTCTGCATAAAHHKAALQINSGAVVLNEAVVDSTPALGDCIDCKMCVQVCPTGIDIRNGTQLECINCTACIDACDAVMIKIGKPTGLIRFDSHQRVSSQTKTNIFNGRVAAYSAVLVALLVLLSFMLVGRSPLQATVMRVPGMLFQEKGDNITNLYNVQLLNKTAEDMPIQFEVANAEGVVNAIGGDVLIPKGTEAKIVFFVEIPRNKITTGKTPIVIEFYSGGKRITTAKTNFMGPVR
jgi:polyferredoxin